MLNRMDSLNVSSFKSSWSTIIAISLLFLMHVPQISGLAISPFWGFEIKLQAESVMHVGHIQLLVAGEVQQP